MQELIEKLTAAGLSPEHAEKAVEIVKNFTKEKFPMFAGAIDNLFLESDQGKGGSSYILD